MKSIARLLTVAMPAILALGSPNVVWSQPPDCGLIHPNCADDGNDWKHVNVQLGGGYTAAYLHATCIWCMGSEGVPVSPDQCHPECVEFASAGQRAAFKAAMLAANTGDVKGLLAAAARIPENVGYHAQREAIQIMGCYGEIVASIPVGEAGLRFAASMQLASSSRLVLARRNRLREAWIGG